MLHALLARAGREHAPPKLEFVERLVPLLKRAV